MLSAGGAGGSRTFRIAIIPTRSRRKRAATLTVIGGMVAAVDELEREYSALEVRMNS